MHAPNQSAHTASPWRRWPALVCLLALLGSVPVLAAQDPPGSTPHFQHLSDDDGLVSTSVYAVTQDPAGYIWIATDGGLQRYDGYRFSTYTHDPRKPASLGENVVTALAFAPDGSLWLGTQDAGLDQLAPGASTFIHHLHDPEKSDSLADDRIFALHFDRRGRMWIATDHGLDRMDTQGSGFHHYATRSTQPNGERILSLYEDTDGRMWVGSDHGVFYYDAKQDALQRFTPMVGGDAARQALTGAPVNVFCRTHDGRLWIGTEHGLALLSHEGAILAFHTAHPGDGDALQSDHVRGILEAAGGGMWIVTLHGGLSHLDVVSGRFTTYRHDATDPASLSDDDLRFLYRDRTGLLWITSYNAGIDIYNPRTRAFGYYHAHPGHADGLASDLVWSMYKDHAGDLWVGTLRGLTRLDPERRVYTQYDLKDRPASAADDRVVNTLLGDDQGTLWVGTDYGLSHYLPAQDRFRFYPLVGAHGDPYETSVNVLFEDRSHRLWAGTQNGLVLFDRQSGMVQRRFMPDARRGDSLPNGLVTALCQTSDGDLWAGTSLGMARFDGEHDHFRIYSEQADPRYSLSSADVLACLEDRDGSLWIGTDNGLDRLDVASGSVRHYRKEDGLPDDNVLGMLQDPHGKLWLATGKGIARFSAANGAFRSYGAADGLQKGSFNQGAVYAAADGELFFGGEHGLNSFYPEALPALDLAPEVAITRFTALGEALPLPADGTAVIRYRQNILAFDFAAFDYAAPAANRFRYTLEGFDDAWHEIGDAHSVTYTNLDPGRYLLRVLASNDGVSWSSREAQLTLRVLPPPWRSAWAYLGYALALILSGALTLHLFGRTIRRRQAYLEERNRRRWAEALHQLIQSVTALEDETAIAACLLDSMKNFIQHDRALFYVERGDGLQLIGCRGGDAVEQIYHEKWPKMHAELLERLRHESAPRLLTTEEAATLESSGRPPRHYLAVPLISGSSGFRLLLVGRSSRTIQTQGVDIAAAMAKQVSVALDKARLIKDLENLATTDGLTRLYNRRTFLQRAENEFERSRRYQRPLSVLMLDVDHFKNVNDSHGHEVGDRVLRILADECRKSLRQQDVLGRYGGEEFVAFLPETSSAVAQEVAERLRKCVENLRVPVDKESIHVTLSIGIATVRDRDRDISALIIFADQALYEAKQQGRNRVVVAN